MFSKDKEDPAEEWQAIIAECDKNGDGKISYGEFVALMREMLKPPQVVDNDEKKETTAEEAADGAPAEVPAEIPAEVPAEKSGVEAPVEEAKGEEAAAK